MKRSLAAFAVALSLAGGLAHAQEKVNYSANEFGAKGDGTTLNTKAIQAAIDNAAEAGGRNNVYFEPGVYLTGSIFVRSNVTLRVDKGVTLLGSQSLKDYPLRKSRVAGIEMTWPAALVNVYQQQNAAITGEGTIDGDGKVFWDSYWTLRKGYEPRGLRWASDYDAPRPRLIMIYDSSNVRIGGGINLKRSGFWTVHICYSNEVTVDGVVIRNNDPKDGRGPSTDGIDIDSSKKILVAHADIAVNDDALCLKAGRDSDGLRVNRPTEDVVIRDSVIRDGAAVVTFGSETSGGFRNIEAYNLTGSGHVPVGILFKSAHTRGGWGENIRIHDVTLNWTAADTSAKATTPVVLRITMNWNPAYSYASIPATEHNYPDYWKVLATPVPDEQGRAHFHDVRIWNVKAVGAKTAFEVDAFAELPVDHFTLEHWDVQAATAGHIDDAKDWTFKDVVLKTDDGKAVEVADDSGLVGIVTRPQELKKVDLSKLPTKEQDIK